VLPCNVMNEINTVTSQEENAHKSLELLRARAEAILADRADINERWKDGMTGARAYDSGFLTVWRNDILRTEKDLAEVSHRIQMINELFPTTK